MLVAAEKREGVVLLADSAQVVVVLVEGVSGLDAELGHEAVLLEARPIELVPLDHLAEVLIVSDAREPLFDEVGEAHDGGVLSGGCACSLVTRSHDVGNGD